MSLHRLALELIPTTCDYIAGPLLPLERRRIVFNQPLLLLTVRQSLFCVFARSIIRAQCKL